MRILLSGRSYPDGGRERGKRGKGGRERKRERETLILSLS
jgi:hypothetical protein